MKRILLAGVLFAGMSTTATAQDARSWNWYSEIVSVDQGAKALTLKAMVEPSFMSSRLNQFKAGNKIVLIWSIEGSRGGDAQTVILISTPEEMKIVDAGYITRAEFVSSDDAGNTVTFKTTVPDAVLQAAASVQPGKWLKVTAPMEQPGPQTVLASAIATDKPAPKPPRQKPVAVVAAKSEDRMAPVRAGEKGEAVKANGGISGTWRLALNVGDSSIQGSCNLAQDGPKLGGTCAVNDDDPTPVVMAVVEGTKINFAFASSLAANNVHLRYAGTLEAEDKITGTTSFGGRQVPFTLTKTAAAPAASPAAVKAGGGISGGWRLVIDVGGGNAVAGDCDLAQDGPKLGGTCAVLNGDAGSVSGTVDGTKIAFSFEATLRGNKMTLQYNGALESDGTKIAGNTSLAGRDATFTMTRK